MQQKKLKGEEYRFPQDELELFYLCLSYQQSILLPAIITFYQMILTDRSLHDAYRLIVYNMLSS